jgi:uncharacterized UPF0160 family protein
MAYIILLFDAYARNQLLAILEAQAKHYLKLNSVKMVLKYYDRPCLKSLRKQAQTNETCVAVAFILNIQTPRNR